MHTCYMKSRAVLAFLLVIAIMPSLLSANIFTEQLTEESVKVLLSKADLAVSNLEADAVANVLSDNVILIMNIKINNKMQVMAPTKQEFIVMLKLGWLSVSNIKHSKTNEVIRSNGNKVIVTADVNETMIVNGEENYVDAKVQATIEIVNGSTLITKLVAYTTL